MKFLSFTLIALIILCILGFFILNTINEPKNTNLTTSQTQKIAKDILGGRISATTSLESPGVYNSKYLSFNYPKTSVIYHGLDKEIAQEKIVLSSFEFDEQMSMINFLTQVLDRSSQASLASLPDVSFRLTNGYQYKEKDIHINGLICMGFNKQNDGAEVSAFCFKDGKEYVFSATGSDFITVKNLFDKVVSTVTFLN